MKISRIIKVMCLGFCCGFTAVVSANDDSHQTDLGMLNAQPMAPINQQNMQREMEANKEDRTRSWLAIQRSNTQATAYQDSLSPEMAQAAQQRAEKSFTHAIPEKFIDDNFGE